MKSSSAQRREPGYQLALPAPISDATQRTLAECLTLLAAFTFELPVQRREEFGERSVSSFPTRSRVARLISAAAHGSNITLPSDVERAVEKYRL